MQVARSNSSPNAPQFQVKHPNNNPPSGRGIVMNKFTIQTKKIHFAKRTQCRQRPVGGIQPAHTPRIAKRTRKPYKNLIIYPPPNHPISFCKTNPTVAPTPTSAMGANFAKQTQSGRRPRRPESQPTPNPHFAKQTQKCRRRPRRRNTPARQCPLFCKTNPPGNPERLLGPFTPLPPSPIFAKRTQSSSIRHFAKQTQCRQRLVGGPNPPQAPFFAKQTQ